MHVNRKREKGLVVVFSLGSSPNVDAENRAKRLQPNVNSPISVAGSGLVSVSVGFTKCQIKRISVSVQFSISKHKNENWNRPNEYNFLIFCFFVRGLNTEIRLWVIFFNFANVLRLIENWIIEEIENLKGYVSEWL